MKISDSLVDLHFPVAIGCYLVSSVEVSDRYMRAKKSFCLGKLTFNSESKPAKFHE